MRSVLLWRDSFNYVLPSKQLISSFKSGLTTYTLQFTSLKYLQAWHLAERRLWSNGASVVLVVADIVKHVSGRPALLSCRAVNQRKVLDTNTLIHMQLAGNPWTCSACLSVEGRLSVPCLSLLPRTVWWHCFTETPNVMATLWGLPLQPAPETPDPIFFPKWKHRKKSISEGILPDIHVSTFSAHSRGAVVTNVLKVFKCWQIQFSFEGCQQFCGSKSHLQSKGESLALTFEKWRLLWIYEKGSLKCFLSNCCWGVWGISQVPRLREASSGAADSFLLPCCM